MGSPATSTVSGFRRSAVFACILLVPAASLGAQSTARGEDPPARESTDTLRFLVDGVTVTATRSERPVFLTPAPAAAVARDQILRLLAASPTQALAGTPGVDVSGVGDYQARPVVRGFRGQRILLLSDGLRLNNARRQQDFGELPALVSTPNVERIEVVKGPSSVLYGTDAIGGVVNLVTKRPSEPGVSGSLGARYGSAQDSWSGSGNLRGRVGRFDFGATVDRSVAESYTAPSGTFGAIRLGDGVRVEGSSSDHWSLKGQGGFEVAPGHRISLEGSLTDAGPSGFGFVNPADYAPELPLIDIRYPEQRFSRVTVGYQAQGLDLALVDQLDVRAYRQDNERDLRFSLTQTLAPGASLEVVTDNATDIETNGARVEAKKLVGERVLVTYGIDAFRDDSRNSDVASTVVTGFGPPQMEADSTPQLPYARFTSFGAFAQSEISVGDLTLVLGGRGQRVSAETETTPGLAFQPADRSQWTLVGAANALYRLSDEVAVVGSVGRGFRAPNLVELFFEGPVAEAGAYQLRSSDLEAETSLSLDVGLRYRGDRVAAEAFVYQNDLDGGIRSVPTGDTIQGLAAFQNTNLESLRYRGLEGSVEVLLGMGFNAGGSVTWVSSEDLLDPDNPVGDTFDTRFSAQLDYQDPASRFWGGVRLRLNGERKDVALGTNPLGDVLPGFAVVDLSGGIRLDQGSGLSQTLVLRLENLTDELYAEFPNASFFRPAPGRRLTMGVEVGF